MIAPLDNARAETPQTSPIVIVSDRMDAGGFHGRPDGWWWWMMGWPGWVDGWVRGWMKELKSIRGIYLFGWMDAYECMDMDG